MPDNTPERRFAAYPSAVVYQEPDGKTPLEHLLWGDYIGVRGRKRGEWFPVCTRHVKEGWAHEDAIQGERVLEVIFVDIGQGDGCLVVTPDDKHILIDAGANDNFIRFLRWRYPKFAKKRHFEAAVISHPDSDHYAGFKRIFEETNVTFGTVYHNGIIERTGKKSDSLGPRAKSGKDTFLTEVITNKAELEELLADPAVSKKKAYPTMLKDALATGRVSDIRMLCAADEFMPGYEANKKLSIEVLGPVTEPDENDQPRLRWFGDPGKTKNGHSVVLRLRYRDVKILLGGDLNIPSEYLLLSHHTGMEIPPTTAEDERLIVEAARRVFQSDIAKACHHGSADFSDLYLQSVNPIATVISSGDDEPHAHPRSDSLGTIGKFSRGARPLIFSTELSRSASEAIKNPHLVRESFRDAQRKLEEAVTPAAKEKALKKFNDLVNTIERSIGVYGAINVRTDGHFVVIAYKIERATDKDKQWDIYRLERTPSEVLHYVSKHEVKH